MGMCIRIAIVKVADCGSHDFLRQKGDQMSTLLLRALAVTCLCIAFSGFVEAEVYTFQRLEDANLFNDANWSPSGLSIDPNVPVNQDLVMPLANSHILSDFGNLDLGTGLLRVESGGLTLARPFGIRVDGVSDDPPNASVVFDSAYEFPVAPVAFDVAFLSDIDMTLGEYVGDSFITGELPLIRSTIDFTGYYGGVYFLTLTPDQFIDGYLDVITVNGKPPIMTGERKNLSVQLSNNGAYVRALYRVPEPNSPIIFLVGLLAFTGIPRNAAANQYRINRV